MVDPAPGANAGTEPEGFTLRKGFEPQLSLPLAVLPQGLLRRSASRVPRWFVGAAYCMAGRRGGVFAHPGTMSSTLLLPEQALSSAPKINNAAMRIMTGGSTAAQARADYLV